MGLWLKAATICYFGLAIASVSACKPAANEEGGALEGGVEKPKKKAKSEEKSHAAPTNSGASKEEAEGEGKAPPKFAVPFAWEASSEEPLAITRSFLKEALADNSVYMEHGPKFFQSFAEAQKPRATVIACSDSPVQTTAFDATPENDIFMLRNIGNQLANSEGSAEYGIEQLHTPLLLVIGHTGCSAVKAAMGDTSTLSKAIAGELDALKVAKVDKAKFDERAWLEGVLENVHNQVNGALRKYRELIAEGQLTVVGAIYDYRNELAQGPGKLSIINVNGNREPERMSAFISAVSAHGGRAGKAATAGAKPAERNSDSVLQALSKLPGIVARPIQSEAEGHARDELQVRSPKAASSEKAPAPPAKAQPHAH